MYGTLIDGKHTHEKEVLLSARRRVDAHEDVLATGKVRDVARLGHGCSDLLGRLHRCWRLDFSHSHQTHLNLAELNEALAELLQGLGHHETSLYAHQTVLLIGCDASHVPRCLPLRE